MTRNMPQILRPRPLTPAGSDLSKPQGFDMAAHRKWFGEVCGANGRAIGKAIREGRG